MIVGCMDGTVLFKKEVYSAANKNYYVVFAFISITLHIIGVVMKKLDVEWVVHSIYV